MERERIGERIRRVRKARGMTLQELSNVCGVSIVTLSRIENGDNVTVGTIEKVEWALGVYLIDVSL